MHRSASPAMTSFAPAQDAGPSLASDPAVNGIARPVWFSYSPRRSRGPRRPRKDARSPEFSLWSIAPRIDALQMVENMVDVGRLELPTPCLQIGGELFQMECDGLLPR